MSILVTGKEISEAAGHLRAELITAKDERRCGRISDDDYKKRVEIIRGCAARFIKSMPLKPGTLTMVLEDIP